LFFLDVFLSKNKVSDFKQQHIFNWLAAMLIQQQQQQVAMPEDVVVLY